MEAANSEDNNPTPNPALEPPHDDSSISSHDQPSAGSVNSVASEDNNPTPNLALELPHDDSSSWDDCSDSIIYSHDQPPAGPVDPVASDIGLQIKNAIRHNDTDALKVLLNSRDGLLGIFIEFYLKEENAGSKGSSIKLTPLALAAALDKTSAIKLLLEHNADADAEILDVGGTALHMAARYGTKESVDLLLPRTTNINLQDRWGYSPLHCASRHGKREIVACLLDANANFDLRDNDDRTPFHIAATYGNTEILRLLYERGSEKYINQGDKQPETSLGLAALGGSYEATNWLLTKGAAIDQLGQYQTALTVAASRGNLEIISLLLDKGANINKTNASSQTPILVACNFAKLEALRELVRRGAEVSDVDRNRRTCFHHIILSEEESRMVIKQMFQILLGAGADINRSDEDGDTPLFLACSRQKIWHVECLLDSGADINQKNSFSGTTALMEACRKTDDKIVSALLQRDADVTATDNEGRTALAVATINNQLNNVKALIDRGANILALDGKGFTSLRYALQNENLEIVLELLAAEEYHSRTLTLKDHSEDQVDDTTAIEGTLLEYLTNGKFEGLDQLHVVLFWAVSNDAAELARKCIDQNQMTLQWGREGDTWFHVASGHGSIKTAELLLDIVAKTPGQPAAWATAGAIIKQNSRGDSPLTISISRPQEDLRNLFWNKIRQLQDTDTAFIGMYSAAADRVLELLARYEKTGYEDILKELLKRWYKEDVEGSKLNTALHWAVQRRKVIVVWWLLSKGGYSSDAIQSAQKLVPGPYEESDPRGHIRDLLLRPPPILDHIPSPNKEHVPTFQVGIEKSADPALNLLGNVVDIMLSDEKSIRTRYAQPSIHDIIYGLGIESAMKKAKDDLGQRDLNALRSSLIQAAPEQDGNGPKISGTVPEVPDWMRHILAQDDDNDVEERSNGTSGDLRARWIHLPVNELRLMRDLVSRLSYDSKRSEMDHMALMKHFNRSWSELAAGGGRCYMKPQCVKKQLEHKDYTNHSLGEGGISRGQCVAIYMPYLTIGNSPDRPSPPTPKSSDGFGTSRDSRRVRHTPLTLDQYYYPTILDTFVRDNDQVLSKFLEKNEQPSETRAGKKILMVNNLWIWVVDEKTIITATADDSDQENTGSLLKFIWSEARNAFGEATSVYSIMELFLSAATGFFVAKFAEISNKGPIEIFRDSMRDVSDQETRLFREFLSGLDGADKPEGGLPNRGLDNESQGQRTGLSRYHVISSETVLLEALRDIRDELQMLGSIAEDQETVWKKAVASYNKGKKSRSFQFYTPEDAKKDIDVMLLEAVNTENYINNLLNLRQAEFGRLQAQDSAQLSNVILVLTLITIVFLPLSFLSSLFALDVNSFPHEDGSLRYPGWWLFPILFGVSTIVSVPAILFAWNVNAILAKFRSRNDPRPAKPQIGNTVKYKELQVGRTIADGGTTLQQNESNGWRKSLKRRLRNRDNSIIPV